MGEAKNTIEATGKTSAKSASAVVTKLRTGFVSAIKKLITLPRTLIVGISKVIRSLLNFAVSAIQELRQVTWLSRKDTVKFSTYVILFVVLGAVIIALMDLAFFRIFVAITS